MIILTQPNITNYNPIRISSIIKNSIGVQYCLAEVPDEFQLMEVQMQKSGIDFWWAVQPSQLDAKDYKLRKYKGGLVEGIMEQINVSKEVNIAYAIYSIASYRKSDEFSVWEQSILLTDIKLP